MSRSSAIRDRRFIPLEDPDANAWDVVPDVAVEVTSPSDRAEVQRKKGAGILPGGRAVSGLDTIQTSASLNVYDTPTSVRS